MGQLDGKIAIVTGAGVGIGEGIARRYVEEGARVCIAELNPEHGKATADRLGDAEDHAAGECAPGAAEAADDDGLEGVDEACGADGGVEVGADGHEDAGDGDHGERDGGRDGEEVAVVDAHDLGGLGVV